MRFPGRRVAAVLVAGVLIAAAAGCGSGDGDGGNDGGNVTLRFAWWGNADRAELTEKAIDAFEAKYPKVKIETEFAEFNAYFQKMATQIAGGGAPDVLQMDYRYIREYADRNVLAEFGTGGADVDTAKMSPSLLSSGRIDDKVYGIPMTQNTQIFMYDPAVWQAAGAAEPTDGWTWNDLEAAATKVAQSTGGKVSGISDFGPIEDWFEVWLRQQGKTLYTADGKLGYTAADVSGYWQLADRLRRSGAATPAALTSKIDGSQANDPVTAKKAASGFGYDSGLTAKTWEIMGREMKISAFPSGGAELGQYAKPSMLISIARRSEHPREAAQLINFLLNDPGAGAILGLSRGMPANSDIRTSVGGALTGPPKLAYDLEQQLVPRLKEAPPPPPKGAGTVKSTFQRIYDDVMFQRTAIPAAADKFMTEAQQALGS